MPKCIFTVGISSSGKSTWAQAQPDFVIVERDRIRYSILLANDNQFIPGHSNMWAHWDYETMEPEMRRLRKEIIAEHMREGENIIFSDTNLIWADKLQLQVEHMLKNGYEVSLQFFPISITGARMRNANRLDSIPEADLDRQFREYMIFTDAPIRFMYEDKIPLDLYITPTGTIKDIHIEGTSVAKVLRFEVTSNLNKIVEEWMK